MLLVCNIYTWGSAACFYLPFFLPLPSIPFFLFIHISPLIAKAWILFYFFLSWNFYYSSGWFKSKSVKGDLPIHLCQERKIWPLHFPGTLLYFHYHDQASHLWDMFNSLLTQEVWISTCLLSTGLTNNFTSSIATLQNCLLLKLFDSSVFSHPLRKPYNVSFVMCTWQPLAKTFLYFGYPDGSNFFPYFSLNLHLYCFMKIYYFRIPHNILLLTHAKKKKKD